MAFSLVELLIVLGIIAILVGMAMPLLKLAQRQADRVNTLALLRRVEAATRLFRNEVGGQPWQEWPTTANPPPAEDLAPPVNRLAFSLAHDLDKIEREALRDEVKQAGARYEPGGLYYIPRTLYNQRAVSTSADDYTVTPPTIDLQIRHLNRLAREWARTNFMIGNTGLKRTEKSGTSPWVESATPVLAAAASRGWAGDYLGLDPEMRRRHVVGEALVDRWGNPLIYLCPVLPGTLGYNAEGWKGAIDTHWFGFGPRSRRTPTTLLSSDLRNSATGGFAFQAEIWSSGADKQISSLRTAIVNRDNLGADDYHRGLQ